MKILYVTGQSPWPPTVGSRLRSYNMLRLLTQQHEVMVALLNNTPEEASDFEEGDPCPYDRRLVPGEPQSRGRYIRTVLFERYRSVLQSLGQGTHREGLRTLVTLVRPDLVWFFRLNAVWRSGCARFAVPVVCDVDDLESRAYDRAIRLLPSVKRALARVDSPLFVRAQREAAHNCDLLLVSNPDDVDETVALTGRSTRVAPNGYDFSVAPVFGRAPAQRIVFYGALRYGPNIDGLQWFVRSIWPTIRRVLPDAQLDIAGTADSAVQRFADEPGVRVCGFVESIRAFVDDAALLVVPLRMGGGTRIKILEAWALGLPVVSTSVGCEGLGARHGETLMVADDPDSFARACVSLIIEPRLGQDMARRAFEFARSRFGWEALAPVLEEALSFATRNRSTRVGSETGR